MEKIEFKIEGDQFNKVELKQISEIIFAYRVLLEKAYLVETKQKTMRASAKEDLKIEIREWKKSSLLMEIIVTASSLGMTLMDLRNNDYSFSMLLECSLRFILDKCSYINKFGVPPKTVGCDNVNINNNTGNIYINIGDNATQQLEKKNDNPVTNPYYHNNIDPETGEGEIIAAKKVLVLSDKTQPQFKKIAEEVDGEKVTSVSSINKNNPNHKFEINTQTTEILSPPTQIEVNTIAVKGKIHRFDTTTKRGKIKIAGTVDVDDGEYSFRFSSDNRDSKDIYINAMLSSVISSDLLVYREIAETPSGKAVIHALLIKQLISNNQ